MEREKEETVEKLEHYLRQVILVNIESYVMLILGILILHLDNDVMKMAL